MTTQQTVYEGFWINWADGQIRGSTLTLNQRTAACLIAFLALYVTWTGTHFWQLLCWTTFQLRSASHHSPQDDPIQTLLRNSESSTSAAITFGQAAWKWRKASQPDTLQRKPQLHGHQSTVLWLQALAIMTMGCFFVAGVFSSRVTNTRSDVLLRPATCGYWDKLEHPGDDFGKEIVRIANWEGQRSLNWVDSSLLTQYCASRGQNDPSVCMAPGRAFVTWNATVQNDCPFNVSCVSKTLFLDSGLVDSMQHLGINTPKQDRVAFRKQLTCAAINASDYTRQYRQNNITQLWPASMSSNQSDNILVWLEPELNNPSRNMTYNGSQFDAIFLGKSEFDGGMAATFAQNEALWVNYNSGRTKGSGEAYAVQVQQHLSGGPEALDVNLNRFKPIPNLIRENSSTILMFLMNGYTYTGGPVDDPWFKTTRSQMIQHEAYSGAEFETWYADYSAIGTMACFEDDEICNMADATPRCAPVNPYGSALRGNLYDSLRLTSKQAAIVHRVQDAMSKSAFADMVVELNGGSMLARRRSFDNTGCSLPSNQWILELQQWFSTSLTAAEVVMKQFVTGYGDLYDHYVVSPSNEDEWMCHAQVTKSVAYSSFNVQGLSIILVLGGLIMLLNMFIEPIMQHTRARNNQSTGAQRLSTRWEQAELLNLHNLHYKMDTPGEKFAECNASEYSHDTHSSESHLKADSMQGSTATDVETEKAEAILSVNESRMISRGPRTSTW